MKEDPPTKESDTFVNREVLYDSGANILPCYLRIENPAIYDRDIFFPLIVPLEYTLILSEEEGIFTPSKKLKHLAETSYGRDFFVQFMEELKKNRYDGIFYKNEFEGTGRSYCVFSSYQIKSQFNWGTFSAKSDNIME